MTENKIRIFHMPGPQREDFPDDETYHKAVDSINQASVVPTSEGQDFAGIPNDKIADVFWVLLNNASALGMGFLQPHSTGPVTHDLARETWEDAALQATEFGRNKESIRVRFDYVFGRPIKMSFLQEGTDNTWSFNTRLYERDQPNPAALITAILEA